ncbi:MAG: 5'-3' exonuclease H3TH domain-containing protein [Acidiferrobacterales bacterium]
MKKLYLIDASIYIFRAYFSLPDSFVDTNGRPSNAVYGFADFLARLLAQTQPRHIAVTFDESLSTSFRNDMYPPYKANRDLPPPELEAQLKACQDLSEALGLATYVSERYEADDLIGTIANAMRPHDFSMVVISGDKDLTQLIADKDIWWDFTRDRQLNTDGIKQRFGVAPHQIVDLIALMGDKVDNIPGVAGIGPKTAVQLLNHYGSLDAIYAGLEQLPVLNLRRAAKVYEWLKGSKEHAYLSQRLARIAIDAPITCRRELLARHPVDQSALTALCEELNFGDRMRERLKTSNNHFNSSSKFEVRSSKT